MEQRQGIHTVEHRYPCDVCNRTFKETRHLKAHQRIHRGSVHIAVICVIKHLSKQVA